MAGQPVTRRMTAILSEQESDVFERLANGDFVTDIVDSIEDVSRHGFYSWIKADDDRQAMFKEVRRLASHGMVEDAMKIVDDARTETGISAAQASLVREQASIRKWVAGKLNAEDYGETRPGVDVSVSIQQLHLEALRHTDSRGIPAGRMNMLPEERPSRDETASDKHLKIMEADDVEVVDDE